MPEATTTATTLARKARRRRTPPTQVGTVTRTQKLTPATEDIVAEVQAKSRRQKAEISQLLHEIAAISEVRHRERAEELVPIGFAMDRPMLDDFVLIGQRMLAGRGCR